MLERGNMNLIRKSVFDIKPSKKVSRNLFGEINHEQAKQDLKKEYRINLNQKSNAWNFDFETCTPKTCSDNTGLLWEKISSDNKSLIPKDKQTSEAEKLTENKAIKSPMSRLRANVLEVEDECQVIRIVNESPPRPIFCHNKFKESTNDDDDVFIVKTNDNNMRSSTKRRRSIQPKISDYMKKKKRRISMDLSSCKSLSKVSSPISRRLRSLSSQVTV